MTGLLGFEGPGLILYLLQHIFFISKFVFIVPVKILMHISRSFHTCVKTRSGVIS
ncbi:hypothetical protein Lalb_Chr15g0077601 [Lupinus albus]|uniref:Uncharacterized protein n=1 Tax=Lupinus albus TaxID=3870 RepID=A0A6A4P8Y2_LUPAL|nr:hypothetical protein Lalb_Chr15g0077601 [Lupinus albus]